MDLIDRIITEKQIYVGTSKARKSLIGKRIGFIRKRDIDENRGMIFGFKQGVVENAHYSNIFLEDSEDPFDTRDFVHCVDLSN